MDTFLHRLEHAVRSSADHNPNHTVAPLAILWPDDEREWEEIVPMLRQEIPLLTLGDYDAGTLTGPAIWIRCMLSRSLPETGDWPEDVAPIVYLPGYSRAQLRAVEECPEELKPLAFLQYSGVLWNQRNNRDWTLAAFLQSASGGLGIPVASDKSTQEALKRAATTLAGIPVDHLKRTAPIKAAYLNSLLAPDTIGRVLQWMNDPAAYRKKRTEAEWMAFREECKEILGFDPESDGELRAGECLASIKGEWKSVWNRFREAPAIYQTVPELLRKAKPQTEMFGSPQEMFPQDNEAEEEKLRQSLKALKDRPASEATETLRKLDAQHGHRRAWVWAKTGKSPLAMTLVPLLALAEAAQPLGADSAENIASRYADGGWKADAAALDALSVVSDKDDVAAAGVAVRAIYGPWLQTVCENFQATSAEKLPGTVGSDSTGDGTVIVFVDGLRMDLARALLELLEASGADGNLIWRFSALPTVTETAKPAVSPVAALFGPGTGLSPTSDSGAAVNIEVLRKALASSGIAVLEGDDVGDPEVKAWTEIGSVDDLGHHDGWRLSHRIREELRVVAERVLALLDAGWKEAIIITDHGWLLMPGGLPKCDQLPEVATEIRKGRCARLKPDSTTTCMTVPWTWDKNVRIAVAPGMTCFVAGREYEHGGLSPQECVIPVIRVTPSSIIRGNAAIESLKWLGLRCSVTLSDAQGLMVDLRTRAADPASSIAGARVVGEDGKVSVLCENDSLIGTAAVIVVYDADRPQRVISQKFTTVGGNDDGDGA